MSRPPQEGNFRDVVSINDESAPGNRSAANNSAKTKSCISNITTFGCEYKCYNYW